jgi:hypothetical protein
MLRGRLMDMVKLQTLNRIIRDAAAERICIPLAVGRGHACTGNTESAATRGCRAVQWGNRRTERRRRTSADG